jgi:sugar phosphate isomerase/epimerase
MSHELCLFSSTPDVAALNFLVRVLTGTPEQLAAQAVEWGYDGIEFMPNPEDVPDPRPFARALQSAGAVLSVVNTGRLVAQKRMLFDADPARERLAGESFKRILDFAGTLGAKVGLGIARGPAIPGLSGEEMDRHALEIFQELAEHARQAGTVIMLEAAESKVTRFIATMDEVMSWVERVNSPGFCAMLDTQQLSDSESSIAAGIRAAKRQARHIHLFDPQRWPPGLRAGGLDWPSIFQVLREEGYRGSASVALAPEGESGPAARRVADFLRTHFTEQTHAN